MASDFYSVARSLESGRTHTVAKEVLASKEWACRSALRVLIVDPSTRTRGPFCTKAGSCSRRIDFLYHSNLGARAFKDLYRREKKKGGKGPGGCRSRLRGPLLLLSCEVQGYLAHKKASTP
jgi:hypothetical protein